MVGKFVSACTALLIASSSIALAQSSGTDKGTPNSSVGSANDATATPPDPMNKGKNVGMQGTSMHKKHHRHHHHHKKHAM